ncbi:putative non-specific serine/threonine protein kinase [Helianthus annuus]|nr:putative non-specific serine/threonine protein kinase [Helianthus annuus]
MRFLNGSLSFFIESSEQSDPVGVIKIPEASSTQYMQLTIEGNLNVFEWQLDKWKVIKDVTTVFQSYSYTAHLSTTWDATYLVYSQPMLLRETNGTQFSCGFLCEGNCTYDNKSSHYIFAILISPTTVSPKQSEVVWSANKDYPVGENAIVNFTAAGDQMLKDGDGSIVWTTNTAGKSVAGINLTDTGNLVLFDDQNSIVWQSFDYPSDSLLPGQKLFSGQKLKSEGMYFAQVTDKGLVAYVESNPPQAYYNMFVDPYGNDKHKGNRYIKFLNGSLSFFIESSEQSGPFDGHLKVFEWQSDSNEWTVVTDLTTGFIKECDYTLACGRNSICSTNHQCSCPGTEYFKAVNDRQPNLGCFEITPLSCNSPNDQEFITLENVTYFTYASSNMVRVNIEACKQACLHNCSCKAAFFNYVYYSNDVDGECILTSEIFTMSSTSYNMKASAFIKVQKATTHHVSHQVAKIVGSTIGSFMLLLVVAIGFVTYVVHKRKKDAEMEEEYLDQVPGMPTRFSYEELKTATEKFSKKLGEGGF